MKRFAAYPLLVAGCSGPLSTLEPGGPAAADIAWLWWGMLAGAAVITVFMVGLVLLALGAPRPVREGRWTLGLGLGLSMVILVPVLAAGLWVGERIIPRDDGVVTVEAHAWQWNWRFTHADAEGAPVESENTLHIPAGQPVDVLITSEDVIHSFWVPRLAGKLDAIPGRTNRARIMADEPGRYAGLCAEFCGQGHARMRFDVVAHADWPPVLNGDGTEAE